MGWGGGGGGNNTHLKPTQTEEEECRSPSRRYTWILSAIGVLAECVCVYTCVHRTLVKCLLCTLMLINAQAPSFFLPLQQPHVLVDTVQYNVAEGSIARRIKTPQTVSSYYQYCSKISEL